ncbi:Epsin-3 [Gracilariopsis chorda]|uniref:Epsin-3 n=1 Tax=Gracilariopsis chorda TaxID=448386 RepID=A0A2V3IJ90_9FLOR|nr:Epsin-3 [Gracilariopsis chorda]|eukprot:PXF42147.1 Epsin-3 [Gracilariopsis chorda]
MDEISRKFRSIDWKSLQKSARKVQASTASALKDMVMTDLENKTRSATADTSWGASVTDLHQIARGTYNPQDYVLIMSIVWQRLGSSRWRCVYKGLEVLKYVIMHGSSRCLTEARGAVGHLEVLREYRKISEGRDVGEGVRNRAALVCDMLNDDELLEAEKEKSREIRAKIESSGGGGSISSDQYRYGGMGSTAGTNVSTSATATFKGYDDDAYDEQPAGAFSKLRIEEKKEVDLLGDDDESAPAASKAYDDDDDDAFDPRGTGTSTASQLKEEDDLLALALSGPGVAALPGPPVTNGGLKTSELVQQLAAQRSLALVPAQHSTNNTEDAPHAEDSHSPLTTGAPFQAFDGFGEGSTQSDVKRPAPVPVKLQRKEDADPFGDLLDTAKKSGVV